MKFTAYTVSIPERVLEALKLSAKLKKIGFNSVSIPERVLEALKLCNALLSIPSIFRLVSIPERVLEALKLIASDAGYFYVYLFQSLKGF